MQRFHDDGRTIYDFSKTFLVICPACGKCATVMPAPGAQSDLPTPYRVSCLHCGFAKDQSQPQAIKPRLQWEKEQRLGKVRRQIARRMFVPIAHNAPGGVECEQHFRLPLYLQTPCCGKILWAYNVEHLNFLEVFISATLREVATNRNQSLASRLPHWMKLSHNREAVLQGIQRLRMKLIEE